MKLELKNVRIHEDMSEETTCFSATLYVDGIRAALCSNRGCGGSTDVNFLPTFAKRLDVIRFCKENPIKYWYRNKEFEISSVDAHIDDLLLKYQYECIIKKKQNTTLLLHRTSLKDADYVIHRNVPLLYTVQHYLNYHPEKLKAMIQNVMEQGYVIMNKNINLKDLEI